MELGKATEEVRETKRQTEDADRVTIVIAVNQPNATSPTTLDIDISSTDNETNEEIAGRHIHIEREGLVPTLNALGTYLNMVATKMAYAIVDKAQTDPGLAKDIGLDDAK